MKAVYYNEGRFENVEEGKVAEFEYDVDGNRIWSDEEGEIYYVFSFMGKVLFEENVSSGEKTSYIMQMDCR